MVHREIRRLNNGIRFIYCWGGGAIPRIGDVIFTTVKTSPATRYKNTVWELVAQNRVPIGAGDGHEGGETVEAGLPNITGDFAFASYAGSGGWLSVSETSGAFKGRNGNGVVAQTGAVVSGAVAVDMDASMSSQIYGASDTVQPPAYYFYFWRRVS